MQPRRPLAMVCLTALFAMALFAAGYRLGAGGVPQHRLADIHRPAAPPDNTLLRDCRNRLLQAAETALDSQPEKASTSDTGTDIRLVKQAVKTLPLSTVAEKTSEITAIPAETIRSMDDPQAFVDNLIDVAAKDILESSSERDAEEPSLGPVIFYGKYGPAHATTSFSSSETVIYAGLPNAGPGNGQVFVKWYRLDDRKILLFRQYHVSQLKNDFIWIRNFSGFKPGRYRVEIYQPQQNLPLLSSGDYWIFPAG